LFGTPQHPYTRALLSATPVPDPRTERRKKAAALDPAYDAEGPEMREVFPRHFVLPPACRNTAEQINLKSITRR
jgi:oligopeptide transport system ATP-binding protein